MGDQQPGVLHQRNFLLLCAGNGISLMGNFGARLCYPIVALEITGSPVLAGGVELVDTPGTGSVFQWDTDAAHRALESMDAAVFVLTADPPV